MTPQSGNQVSTSLGNSGLYWTVFARNRDTAVPAEGNGDLQTYWSVSLWRDPDNVPHCRILSPDKTKWRLISATLCGRRRCFVADQWWFMTRIREEEEAIQRIWIIGFTFWLIMCANSYKIPGLRNHFPWHLHKLCYFPWHSRPEKCSY